MPQVKYREYYQKMVIENRSLFDQFLKLNDLYKKHPQTCEAEFHSVGQQVLNKIRDFDRRLCSAMGRGVYNSYSQTLSEKFWNLARQDFDQLDMVGVKIQSSK